jgi:hypothetical protein
MRIYWITTPSCNATPVVRGRSVFLVRVAAIPRRTWTPKAKRRSVSGYGVSTAIRLSYNRWPELVSGRTGRWEFWFFDVRRLSNDTPRKGYLRTKVFKGRLRDECLDEAIFHRPAIGQTLERFRAKLWAVIDRERLWIASQLGHPLQPFDHSGSRHMRRGSQLEALAGKLIDHGQHSKWETPSNYPEWLRGSVDPKRSAHSSHLARLQSAVLVN